MKDFEEDHPVVPEYILKAIAEREYYYCISQGFSPEDSQESADKMVHDYIETVRRID